MKVTKEKIENREAFLTIEMEPAEVEESLAAAYKRLVMKTNIPGFRKGKAPRPVLERHMGKESMLEDAINHMLPQAYDDAIKEQEIEAIAYPRIEVVQTDPVVFKAVVPLSPVVEIGDYHSIKVVQEKVETTEDNINAVIEELRHGHATWEPVERAVDFGDLVVLNIESTLGEKPFINQNGVQYQVLRDSPAPAPGFAEQLAGMQKGEDKEFNIRYPADYHRNELADKEVTFKVKVVEVKQEILSDLDDAFAKQVSPEFETMDSLREQVSIRLKLSAEEKALMDFQERTIKAAVDLARVEFPPVMIEAEIDQLLGEQARRLQMSGSGLEEYLKSINKTGEQLREELRPVAEKRVTNVLVLGKIAEEEKIEVNDADIDSEIETMVGRAGENKEAMKKYLDSERSRESIKQGLLTRKTIETLAEIAKGADIDKSGGKEQEK